MIDAEAKAELKQWMRRHTIPVTAKAELNKILEKHGGKSTVTLEQVDEARDALEFNHDDDVKGESEEEETEEE